MSQQVRLRPGASHSASVLVGHTDLYVLPLSQLHAEQVTLTVRLKRKNGHPLLMLRFGTEAPSFRKSRLVADVCDEDAFEQSRNEHCISTLLPSTCTSVCIGVMNHAMQKRETCYYTLSTSVHLGRRTASISKSPAPLSHQQRLKSHNIPQQQQQQLQQHAAQNTPLGHAVPQTPCTVTTATRASQSAHSAAACHEPTTSAVASGARTLRMMRAPVSSKRPEGAQHSLRPSSSPPSTLTAHEGSTSSEVAHQEDEKSLEARTYAHEVQALRAITRRLESRLQLANTSREHLQAAALHFASSRSQLRLIARYFAHWVRDSIASAQGASIAVPASRREGTRTEDPAPVPSLHDARHSPAAGVDEPVERPTTSDVRAEMEQVRQSLQSRVSERQDEVTRLEQALAQLREDMRMQQHAFDDERRRFHPDLQTREPADEPSEEDERTMQILARLEARSWQQPSEVPIVVSELDTLEELSVQIVQRLRVGHQVSSRSSREAKAVRERQTNELAALRVELRQARDAESAARRQAHNARRAQAAAATASARALAEVTGARDADAALMRLQLQESTSQLEDLAIEKDAQIQRWQARADAIAATMDAEVGKWRSRVDVLLKEKATEIERWQAQAEAVATERNAELEDRYRMRASLAEKDAAIGHLQDDQMSLRRAIDQAQQELRESGRGLERERASHREAEQAWTAERARIAEELASLMRAKEASELALAGLQSEMTEERGRAAALRIRLSQAESVAQTAQNQALVIGRKYHDAMADAAAAGAEKSAQGGALEALKLALDEQTEARERAEETVQATRGAMDSVRREGETRTAAEAAARAAAETQAEQELSARQETELRATAEATARIEAERHANAEAAARQEAERRMSAAIAATEAAERRVQAEALARQDSERRADAEAAARLKAERNADEQKALLAHVQEAEAALRADYEAQRISQTDTREMEVSKRESLVAEQEASVTAREVDLITREEALSMREEEYAAQYSSMMRERTVFAARQGELRARDDEQDRREQDLDERDAKVPLARS